MSNRKGIMLATPFEEHRLERWPRPFFVQPKLKGLHCAAKWNEHEKMYILRSSEGNYIKSIPHIEEQVNKFMSATPLGHNFGLDGELYVHGWTQEEINRVVKRKSIHPRSAEMQFHIFDFIHPTMNQESRLELLEHHTVKSPTWQEYPALDWVSTFECESRERIDYYLEMFLAQGYEGIIMRKPNAYYEEKKSYNVLKHKPTRRDSYKIVGFEEEESIEGFKKNALGSLVLEDKIGNRFNCGSGPVLTRSGREELWKHRDTLIGRLCVVKYNFLTGARKVPESSVCLEIR